MCVYSLFPTIFSSLRIKKNGIVSRVYLASPCFVNVVIYLTVISGTHSRFSYILSCLASGGTQLEVTMVSFFLTFIKFE